MSLRLRLATVFLLVTSSLVYANDGGPQVTAKSAVVLDALSGRVLWSKDGDTPRYPASTTKIMTGLLLIEHCKPDEIIVGPPDIDKVGESSMHLKPGEKVTAKDMLYALMLRSANDGCVAVAVHIAGSVEKFTEMMNQRAKELGCTHTHFDNPNGLNDKAHMISAHDLAIIAREAMTYPMFREVVRTIKHKIDRTINTKDEWMVSHNKWLRKDPTADGIKTGWTIPAGHCFVGSATRNGYRLITVVLHSDNWQQDHSKLLDWGFANFRVRHVYGALQPLQTLPVLNGKATEVTVGPSTPVDIVQNGASDGSFNETTGILPAAAATVDSAKVAAPVKKGDVVGTRTLLDAKGAVLATIPLVALDEVPAKSSPLPKKASLPFLLVGGVLCGSAVAMRSKAKRMRTDAKSTFLT